MQASKELWVSDNKATNSCNTQPLSWRCTRSISNTKKLTQSSNSRPIYASAVWQLAGFPKEVHSVLFSELCYSPLPWLFFLSFSPKLCNWFQFIVLSPLFMSPNVCLNGKMFANVLMWWNAYVYSSLYSHRYTYENIHNQIYTHAHTHVFTGI